MNGEHVKHLRTRLGMTQTAFAERLGVSLSLISRIEPGAIPISRKLACKIYAVQRETPPSVSVTQPERKPSGPCRQYTLFLDLRPFEERPSEVRTHVATLLRRERRRIRTLGTGEGLVSIGYDGQPIGSAWLVNRTPLGGDRQNLIRIFPRSFLSLDISGMTFDQANDFHTFIHADILGTFYDTLRTGKPFKPVQRFYCRGRSVGCLHVQFTSKR
jgi:transcriptional regulator with XRE-family HTH domain